MKFRVYRRETKGGVDFRVADGDIWRLSGSKYFGYIESPTRKGAINQLKDKLTRAIAEVVNIQSLPK